MATLRRRCWLLLIVAALLLAAAANLVSFPLHDSDKIDAARNLVAWIVNGRSVPGFGDQYPDAQRVPEMKEFLVICDFFPSEVFSLSEDPRVWQITARKQDGVYKLNRFNDAAYLVIELKAESATELVVAETNQNQFGPKPGYRYRFAFRRTLWGLRASGKML